MAEYLVQGADLSAVAEAIRQKGGTTELLQFPDGFVSAVEAIETGGTTEDRLVLMVKGQLTEFVDSEITTIARGYLFYQNADVVNVELPNAVGDCPNYTFYYATGLQRCILPQITTLGSNCFAGASGLTEGDFSAVETINGSAFRYCTKLTRLDFPMVTKIAGQNAFQGCSKLATLILRSSTMVTLEKTNAFSSTPIASGTGYIYVPSALIDSYKADSVWSTYAGQFRAIEDYPDV